MIRKADIFLFIFLVLFGLLVTYFSVAGSSDGGQAVVTVDGKPYGTYSLTKDQTIIIKQDNNKHHINKITIKKGKVTMAFSDCHNQICVNHPAISRTNESIVCLPNKVMIEIKGKEDKYDAISN